MYIKIRVIRQRVEETLRWLARVVRRTRRANMSIMDLRKLMGGAIKKQGLGLSLAPVLIDTITDEKVCSVINAMIGWSGHVQDIRIGTSWRCSWRDTGIKETKWDPQNKKYFECRKYEIVDDGCGYDDVVDVAWCSEMGTTFMGTNGGKLPCGHYPHLEQELTLSCDVCWDRIYVRYMGPDGETLYTEKEDHTRTISEYVKTCGQNEGKREYKRFWEEYECSQCKGTYIYWRPASVSNCEICGGTHGSSQGWTGSTQHQSVARYLVCGY